MGRPVVNQRVKSVLPYNNNYNTWTPNQIKKLKEVFSSAPDLKEHCKLFLNQNPQQRLQISEQLLQLVD